MTEKDILLLIVAFIFGIYASIIAGRVLAFYQLRSEALREVQLLSAYLCANSDDLTKRIPRVDRALVLMSIQAMCLGHKNMYERLHCVAEEMERAIDKIVVFQHPNYIDVSNLKTKWLCKVAVIKPNLIPFLTGKEPVNKALSKYREKEDEYLLKAQTQISKYPGMITPFEKI